jgi:hypothetical protein
MVYAGQLECYEKAQEIIQRFLRIEVDAMKIHRLTNGYGELAGKLAKDKPKLPQADKVVYAQLDGSMIQTRAGWKEVKAGRVFLESDYVKGSQEVDGRIKHSEYVAVVGDKDEFVKVFEQYLEGYQSIHGRLVFVTDGATWIKNWIEDNFPQATQILDYYHAAEHLYGFANEYFAEGENEHMGKWIGAQKELLMASGVKEVIKNIEGLPSQERSKKARENLLQYYRANESRMDYARYKKIGAGIISSGAIEATHRNLIQERLKLSGQRWTIPGAQNVLNLRCLNLSDHWGKVVSLVDDTQILNAAA